MSDLAQKNSRMAKVVLSIAVGMVGMAYAAVPLYDLFCKVTGYGGTTQEALYASDVVLDRTMKVRFSANLNHDMPWQFKPSQNSQTLQVGEQAIAYFEAYNPSDKVVAGTATYNVTPHKAGEYFAKIDCFCFTEQVLQPGERVQMPVVYFIDPLIDEDVNTDDVKEVTLSYTFFVKAEDKLTNKTIGR